MNRIVIFNYGQLFEFTACYGGQPHVATCNARGTDTRVYSTGRLERALKRATETYVVCTKSQLEAHDRWWSVQLPRDHIFLSLSRQQILDLNLVDDATAQTLYPWLMLCDKLSLDVTDGELSTVEEVKEFISDELEVTFGDAIRPWDFSHHPA